MTSDRQDTVVVNIIASSYAGSTWLNLVLGAHPAIFSVGELDRLVDAGKPACKLHGNDCPFWSRVNVRANANPFPEISRAAGNRYLVVNNTRRFLDCQSALSIDSRFIWLVRDGRAIVASTLRKYPGRGVWRATRSWVRAIRHIQELYNSQATDRRRRVIYEQLLQDKRAQVESICRFLGLEFDERMLRYWETEHHFVGGNPGPLLAVADAQATGDLHRQPRAGYRDDLSFYARSDPARFRDDRWQRELTDGQLRIFALIAGRLNRALGYPRSLDRQSVPVYDPETATPASR